MRVTIPIATALYSTGMDPRSRKPVELAEHMMGRKLQRALAQFFEPENDSEVREALMQAGRGDLIGGCEGLIPQPEEAIEARRRQANRAARNGHDRSVANPAAGEEPGERPVPAEVGNGG